MKRLPNPNNSPMTRERWQRLVADISSRRRTFVCLDSSSQACSEIRSRWNLLGWGKRQSITITGTGMDCLAQGSAKNRWMRPSLKSSQQLWNALESVRQQCRIYWADEPQLPFHGGLVGLLHYEAAAWCDESLSVLKVADDPNAYHVVLPTLKTEAEQLDYWLHAWEKDALVPQLEFIECEGWALWDEYTGNVWVSNPNSLFHWALHYLEAPHNKGWSKLLGQVPVLNQPWQASLSQPQFEAKAETLLQAIQQGECYQANLSIQWKNQLRGDLWPVYQALTAKNPSPFAGFWQTDAQTVVCNSPERLVQIENRWQERDELPQQWVTTRPIAGTRGRGATPQEDEAIGNTLLGDTKEQAEHLMLVDLLRNDIGKIATVGSVNVRELMVLERYAHVTHLVSDVEGRLLPNTTPWQVLQALFPGGTITGCPKIRSVQWLKHCEPVLRGPYTGSMGYVDALTGAMDWNIIIRSVYATRAKNAQRLEPLNPLWDVAFHAGAGIVADSIPAHEYRECLRKAHSIFSLWE